MQLFNIYAVFLEVCYIANAKVHKISVNFLLQTLNLVKKYVKKCYLSNNKTVRAHALPRCRRCLSISTCTVDEDNT